MRWFLFLTLAACAGGADDAAPDTDTDVADTDAADTDAPAEDGAALFAANCAICHGETGGGGSGPPLSGLTAEFVEAQVRDGAPGMPAFDGVLTDAEIDAIVAYSVETFGT